MEIKLLPIADVAIKASRKSWAFSGYASRFGLIDAYGDTIEAGAYAETLKTRERPVRMRWNHYGPVIGVWSRIEEDESGLYVEGELTEGHSVATDVRASMLQGAVDGLSIGFRPLDFEETDGGRLLKKIELVEVSVVEEPADLGARVLAAKMDRSAIDDVKSLKDAEDLLREVAGFSVNTATSLVSRIKAIAHGERERKSDAAEIAALFQRFKHD